MKTGSQIAPSEKQGAFTYIELLVVVGILLFCTVLILPVLGRTTSNSATAQCLNNLRQFSSAISMYTVENRDTLPGPCWTAIYRHYGGTSQMRYGLVNYLAPYLGVQPPTAFLQQANVADCPSSVRFRKIAPSNSHVLATNVSYHLIRFITNNLSSPPTSICAAQVEDRYPFGYPSKSQGVAICGSAAFDYPGAKINQIKYPGTQWAMADVDAMNSSSSTNTMPGGANYGQFLPSRRVHQNTRNYMFFDGHAATIND